MILIHPSSIGKIMTETKSIDPDLLTGELLEISKKKVKTEEDKKILQPLKDMTLSETAKSYLKMIAKQVMYDFYLEVDVKYMRKGLACEGQSIELLNSVLFKNYTKNSVRIETDLLSGECDILHNDHIRDIKTAWSLATFPCIKEDAHDNDYEYQGRAYMHLYDRPVFHLDYCLVSTPDDLCKYEQKELHYVDHIDPRLRVTTVTYERDLEIERKMLVKCKQAQLYVEKIKQLVLLERDI